MKTIGIDARLFSQTGVGTYLRNFIHYLQESDTQDICFYIYMLAEDSHKLSLKDSSKFVVKKTTHHWHTVGEQLGFGYELMRDRLDLMHFTYFSFPFWYNRPFVATVHDVTPLLFKTGRASTKNRVWYELKHSLFRFVLSKQIQNACRIITPTLTVKNEIGRLYGNTVKDKTTFLYEGVNNALINIKGEERLKDEFSHSFLLYVGNYYPHKNIERLIHAMAYMRNPVHLVLVGPDDFFSKKIQILIRKLSLEKKIHVFHNPSPEELVFFYTHATALIHPSLSEGFGLPLVEAMYFKLPIIASDIPVFKELLSDNYIFFDPYDSKDIGRAVERFMSLTHPVEYISHYKEYLRKYSFELMTSGIVSIYKECLKRL